MPGTGSTIVIISRFGLMRGRLALDETDKKRSKSAKLIHKVYKIKDKASGGYINGQKLVFLFLITDIVSIPVGFRFHMSDPKLKAWKKSDEKLRKKGVSKKNRPPEPPRDEKYSTVAEIALFLLRQFRRNHPEIKIDCILADALYGTRSFLDETSAIFGGVQVISQIRENQNVRFKDREINVKKYFSRHTGVKQKATIRGGKKVTVEIGSARMHVCSHETRRFVIALKYEGEQDYRYIVATDLSWRTLDIVEAYFLRWLIEVFFEDWKISEGWGQIDQTRRQRQRRIAQGRDFELSGRSLSFLSSRSKSLPGRQTCRMHCGKPDSPNKNRVFSTIYTRNNNGRKPQSKTGFSCGNVKNRYIRTEAFIETYAWQNLRKT